MMTLLQFPDSKVILEDDGFISVITEQEGIFTQRTYATTRSFSDSVTSIEHERAVAAASEAHRKLHAEALRHHEQLVHQRQHDLPLRRH